MTDHYSTSDRAERDRIAEEKAAQVLQAARERDAEYLARSPLAALMPSKAPSENTPTDPNNL